MKNKKINRIIAGSVILILVLFFIVFIIFNYTTDENSFSIVEKKWITSNTNNIIDVNVFNDVPIYGYNGEGIIFSFLIHPCIESQVEIIPERTLLYIDVLIYIILLIAPYY